MLFLAPWLLLGLTAAAIPLVLHLRRARHIEKIVFSTTRFFDEQFIRSARRARLQNLLLMLLRMALLCLLALALARPLLKMRGFTPLAGRRRVAIVLDDSASMGMVTERGSLLDRAREAALKVVEDLSPTRGDSVTVILAGERDAGPRALFDEPTPDLAAARQAIEQVRVTDLASNLDAAVAAAARALGADPDDPGADFGAGGLEIFVISDLQQSAWAGETAAKLSPRIGLLLVSTQPALPAAADNLSVDAVQFGAPRPVLGVPFPLRALLTNHGDRLQRVEVDLVIDGQTVAHRSVQVAAARSHVVRFVHRFTVAGWAGGRVSIRLAQAGHTDALPADNHRHFAVRVEQSIHVLAINGAPSRISAKDELFFFRLALTAGSDQPDAAAARRHVRIKQIEPDQLNADILARYPVVVMANQADLQPAQLQLLERYVDGGGGLWIALGDHVDPAAYNTWFGPHRLHGGLLPARLGAQVLDADPLDPLDPDTGGFVATVNRAHPAIAGFADAQLGYLTSVRFTGRFRIDAAAPSVLMSTSDGQPVLVEKRFGRGRVMLLASTLDRDWTNFPLQPAYVPWVYHMVSYLSYPQLDHSGFIRTGRKVRLPTSIASQHAPQIVAPDGTIIYPEPAPPTADRAGGLLFTETESAGVYTVRDSRAGGGDDRRQLLIAANIPSDESQPVYFGRDDLAATMGPDTSWLLVTDPDAVADVGEVARQGHELWNYLLILALLVGLFEPWLANQLTRRRGSTAADSLDRRSVPAPIDRAPDSEAA